MIVIAMMIMTMRVIVMSNMDNGDIMTMPVMMRTTVLLLQLRILNKDNDITLNILR